MTLSQIIEKASPAFATWLRDHKNRRQIPFRFEQCGYVPVRNKKRKDRFWLIGGERQAVYVLSILSVREQLAAAEELTRQQPQQQPEIPF